MNVVILLAGQSKRFSKYFKEPKHLVLIKKKTMLRRVVDSLKIDAKYIFVVLKNDYLEKTIKEISQFKIKKKIIILKNLSRGPAESALFACKHLPSSEELIVTNCDQIMNWNPNFFLDHAKKFDGCIVTYHENTEANSYAKIDKNLIVTEVAEKKVISNISLNGIHYWKKTSYFVNSVNQMIKNNVRVNNEFYIAPTYNYMIKKKKKVSIFHIPNEQHNSVGSFGDFEKFIKNEKI